MVPQSLGPGDDREPHVVSHSGERAGARASAVEAGHWIDLRFLGPSSVELIFPLGPALAKTKASSKLTLGNTHWKMTGTLMNGKET